ncbi:hypothetical protein AVEN_39239-1 [Araneus ventricosus]|uniref:Uncharacterized protein n=1 Tax=Araneus ventricosus TaxID=182803 RepID=A0A4Y2ERH4_ARAVE|nr:hypothetical protein AVEN_39239-1 [Araneus ventricosus]
MSKRYRGRYLTARLCKTPAEFQRSTKGMIIFNSTATKGAILTKDLATVTGSIKRPFHQSSDYANQQHGVAPRVFTLQLSFSSSAIVFPS